MGKLQLKAMSAPIYTNVQTHRQSTIVQRARVQHNQATVAGGCIKLHSRIGGGSMVCLDRASIDTAANRTNVPLTVYRFLIVYRFLTIEIHFFMNITLALTSSDVLRDNGPES